MKPRTTFLSLLFFITAAFSGYAQCGNTMATLTYDTAVSGIGATIDPYLFSFPKFDGSQGTLMEVRVASVVTLSYKYDIENALNVSRTHSMRLERIDEVSSAALSFPVSADYLAPWKSHGLAASDGVTGSGPDFNAVAPYNVLDNDTIINETAFNTADFMGTGSVSFDYSTIMLRTTNPASGANITNDAATDVIKFSVTYVYCSNIMLSSNITSFTAHKKDDWIDLAWFSKNETPGNRFEILKSADGRKFTPVNTLPGDLVHRGSGQYQFRYIPKESESGKIIFRIKEIESTGTAKFSALKVIDLGTKSSRRIIHIVPNPSKGGNATIVFDKEIRGDWQLDIYTVSGQLLARKLFPNSLTGRIPSNLNLSAGMYILNASNQQTGQSFAEKLTVY
jgi:hypothetical protein